MTERLNKLIAKNKALNAIEVLYRPVPAHSSAYGEAKGHVEALASEAYRLERECSVLQRSLDAANVTLRQNALHRCRAAISAFSDEDLLAELLARTQQRQPTIPWVDPDEIPF